MAVTRKTLSSSTAYYLGEAASGFRAMHRRGLLAPNRIKSWAEALESGKYVKNGLYLGVGEPTPEKLEEHTGLLNRSVLGVLCETSTMARLIPKGDVYGVLRQEPLDIEGMPTSALLKDRPEYDYENSPYFPCAAVRAYLIASNKLDEYCESPLLQLQLIHYLLRLGDGISTAEFSDAAALLRKAVAPVML